MDWTLFSEPVAQLILATAGLVILALVGLFLLGKIRQEIRQHDQSAIDLLTEFRNLRDRGLITEKEYERIRANLATQSQRQEKMGERKEGSLPTDFTRDRDR